MARIETITSLSNPKIKGIAALAMKKERAESGLFVVEGLQLVGFGIEAGWELEVLVVGRTQISGTKTQELLGRLYDAAGLVLEVTQEILEKLGRKENPQGVLVVFKQRVIGLSDCRITGDDVWVVLEEVRDPGNLGTVIRTVDAVGAAGVMMVGTCTDLWAGECVRATMGSVFHVPVVMTTRENFLTWRKGQDAVMVGTHLQGAVDYREVSGLRGGKGLLLCMGTEQSGLSEELAEACDARVKIAMRGKAESLNLGIATGVMLYEIFRNT